MRRMHQCGHKLTIPLKMVTLDDQVKAYIKKIMSQLSRWMQKSKISKLVVVVTSKETGEHIERWQFDVSAGMSKIRQGLILAGECLQ